jgi:hypothetical protein
MVVGQRVGDADDVLATAIRCRALAFNASSSASSWSEPICAMSRDPRRKDHIIWTAVATEAVFSVRMYGTTGRAYCARSALTTCQLSGQRPAASVAARTRPSQGVSLPPMPDMSVIIFG